MEYPIFFSIASSTASIILIGSISLSAKVQATPVKDINVSSSISKLKAPIGTFNFSNGK